MGEDKGEGVPENEVECVSGVRRHMESNESKSILGILILADRFN